MANLKDTYVKPMPRITTDSGKFKTRINYEIRKKLEEMLNQGRRIKDISLALGITRHQIWHERRRCPKEYNADQAQEHAENGQLKVLRTGFSIYHQQMLKGIFNNLENALVENKQTKYREYIKMSLSILTTLGIGEGYREKSIEKEKEITAVIKLREMGCSYREIEQKLHISKTKISKIVNQYKKTGENYDDYIKSKWISNTQD